MKSTRLAAARAYGSLSTDSAMKPPWTPSDPAVGGGGRQARPSGLHTGSPVRQTGALAPGVIAPRTGT